MKIPWHSSFKSTLRSEDIDFVEYWKGFVIKQSCKEPIFHKKPSLVSLSQINYLLQILDLLNLVQQMLIISILS